MNDIPDCYKTLRHRGTIKKIDTFQGADFSNMDENNKRYKFRMKNIDNEDSAYNNNDTTKQTGPIIYNKIVCEINKY